jgi:uncharacterized glyoxalase superfamily protein PhnB
MTDPGATSPDIYPAIRYRDAPAALAWLAEEFGCREQFVVRGEGDTIVHAQISLGRGIVMVGSMMDDDLGLKSPAELGGVTQAIYVCLDDVDGHHARARAAGAEIVRPLQDTEYGSREYTARDREGHLWSFGTYRPEPVAETS